MSEETYRFGPHCVDVEERTLTRAGSPIPLRAKLFDTLVTLLRSAGRLVTRDELIAAVWPDSIVEEGNLSHNVSALRKALRDGQDAKYIETVPKRGYRFVHELERPPAAPGPSTGGVERARRFFEQGAWNDAYRSFAEARAAGPLSGADSLRLAEAARWSGRFDELVPLLEEAVEAHRREDDPIGAARATVDLGLVLVDRRRPALAASQARRARRILSAVAEPDTRTRAGLARLEGRLRWTEGDWHGALACAQEAIGLARSGTDRGGEALALVEAGHSLLVLERYDEAATVLEEAGAVAMSSEVEPYAAGMTLCGLIFAWRTCGRWDRAAEWVDASSRWSDEVGVAYFPGLCRVHRGELICLRGELERAEEDVARGIDELARADSGLAGAGLRELGAVRLRRGDLDGAEEAFGRALEYGTDPQPGLARLRAIRGEPEAARRDLERFLAAEGQSAGNILDREHVLEALAEYVSLAAPSGETEGAHRAVERLQATAAATRSPYHRATADGAAGELALAEGRTEEAIALLRSSWRAWTEVPAPYEAARARERLGDALLAGADPGRARMELEGAAATFERLGARLDLERLQHRLPELGGSTGGTSTAVVARGEIVEGDALQTLVGEEAWRDLSAWLDRTLSRCWSEHGGRSLPSDAGTYAVAFDDLETCLRCAAFVHRSLREHRALHGFAPELRVAVVHASALAGEPDVGELQARARSLAGEGGSVQLTVLADEATTASSAGLAQLRRSGVSLRVLSPGEGRSHPTRS